MLTFKRVFHIKKDIIFAYVALYAALSKIESDYLKVDLQQSTHLKLEIAQNPELKNIF